MTYKTILATVFVLALVLTACGPASTEPTLLPTEPPSATELPAGAETPGVPVAGAAIVNVSESAEFGTILVDVDGYSLYLFMQDTPNSGISTCMDADGCATEWPPLLTEGVPVAGEGVDEALLGTLTREDGSVQVTYNGHPLYLFFEDTAAGDTKGQGLEEFGGLWFLVSPAGEAIEEAM